MTAAFHIHTFGCRVNRVESDKIAAALMAMGWEQSPLELADVAIINTCTVTGEADRKNRKAINQALSRMGNDGPVILTGCSVNLGEAGYAAIDPRVHCETEKEQVAALAARLVTAAESPMETQTATPFGAGFRTRGGIKIQDGCDNACTFCIVHTARGKAHSMSAAQVLAEAQALVEAGAQELVLVGIDSGAYSYDGMRLHDLVQLLLEQTQVGRIRITSIEPQSVTPQLIDLMTSANGRLCRHLHLVLQSGSSKVLREMARHYTAQEFLELVQKMRTAIPQLALSTDVIAGFPGETDEDFQQTCDLVRECGFMRLHVFPYSLRPGTPAAARKNQISPQVKQARAAALGQIGTELAQTDMRRRLGSTEAVVVERDGRGTSESFHEVRFNRDLPVGTLEPMTFTAIDPEHNCLLAE